MARAAPTSSTVTTSNSGSPSTLVVISTRPVVAAAPVAAPNAAAPSSSPSRGCASQDESASATGARSQLIGCTGAVAAGGAGGDGCIAAGGAVLDGGLDGGGGWHAAAKRIPAAAAAVPKVTLLRFDAAALPMTLVSERWGSDLRSMGQRAQMKRFRANCSVERNALPRGETVCYVAVCRRRRTAPVGLAGGDASIHLQGEPNNEEHT